MGHGEGGLLSVTWASTVGARTPEDPPAPGDLLPCAELYPFVPRA